MPSESSRSQPAPPGSTSSDEPAALLVEDKHQQGASSGSYPFHAGRRVLSCALSASRRQGSAAGDGNTTCQKASVAKP
ncbi:unnamed protein product [Gadus morhua 'NCC']